MARRADCENHEVPWSTCVRAACTLGYEPRPRGHYVYIYRHALYELLWNLYMHVYWAADNN